MPLPGNKPHKHHMGTIPTHTTHHSTGISTLAPSHTHNTTRHTPHHSPQNAHTEPGHTEWPRLGQCPCLVVSDKKSHHPGSPGPLYIPWAAGPRLACPQAHPLPDTWQSHASHNGHECGETLVVPPHPMCYSHGGCIILLHGPLQYNTCDVKQSLLAIGYFVGATHDL